MNQFSRLTRQLQQIVNALGIHPLVLIAGLLFCLFFPRFFLLAALACGVYWFVRNAWNGSASRQGGRGRSSRGQGGKGGCGRRR